MKPDILLKRGLKREIKMKYFKRILIFITFIINLNTLYASDAIITFYVHKYPYFKNKSEKTVQSSQEISQKIQQPDYILNQIIKHYTYTKEIPGVMCFYAGNIAFSDATGQVTFSRLQQDKEIYIIITPEILPAYILGPTTIHHWVLNPQYESAKYLITQTFDETTQLYYFETKKVAAPDPEAEAPNPEAAAPNPETADLNIPLNSIIIISDPQYVFIPEGATFTEYSPNLTLPNIYIKKGFCFIHNSFYDLSIKHYFDKAASSYKQEELSISQIMQPGRS